MVSIERKKLEQVLAALETGKPMFDAYWGGSQFDNAIAAIKEALAQDEQSHESEDPNLAQDKRVFARIEAMKKRKALAQPEQEPVAWMRSDGMKAMPALEKEALLSAGLDFYREIAEEYSVPLYTTPPKRQPLTEQFVMDSTRELSADVRWPSTFIDVWRLCEAAHGIKE